MSKRFYKVYKQYSDEFIRIDDSEIEVAIFAHMTGKTGFFNNGSVSNIGMIVPDFHRSMGWNDNYKLKPEDWAELDRSGVQKLYNGFIGEIKHKVHALITANRADLIGKNEPLPALA